MQRTRLTFLTLVVLAIGCAPSGRSDDDPTDNPGSCDFGEERCGDDCVDTRSDELNCGGCGIPCDGTCTLGTCQETCEPGTSEACYSGTPATENVGLCKGGTRTCGSGGTWGSCEGEVLPAGETCGNGIDENCSGQADESTDLDGDGYTTCDGDCCDSTSACDKPELVNPGAIDVAGNNLDDDCDGMKDNVLATMCDTGLASNSGSATDYARAMELCQTADPDATGRDKKWGVVSARFTLPSGSGDVFAQARSIRPGFGATTVQAGASLAVLSTGVAADANDTNPNFVPFQLGSPHTSGGGFPLPITSEPPADWVAANGGSLPNAPGCPEIDSTFGIVLNDPVMLELKIRVPSNAKSFSFSSNFLSAEYPEYVCSPYNDFFVVLLDSSYAGSPANPADKNLAIYKAPGGQTYPVGVNLAAGNTGLFRECKNGPTGCAEGSVAGDTDVCTGTGGLGGTGFDTLNPEGLDEGYCGESNLLGGGTGWLETAGNVKGGETITLRIAIWDTSDAQFDSIVLLDNFKWSLEAAMPGTVID